ncbi:hypothetical protein CE91St58_11000 [Lachnospiraceae bacterium]|nr:hypothetical protein CE91St58_11000 [Lachnospiraceae bacterium]
MRSGGTSVEGLTVTAPGSEQLRLTGFLSPYSYKKPLLLSEIVVKLYMYI